MDWKEEFMAEDNHIGWFNAKHSINKTQYNFVSKKKKKSHTFKSGYT